MQATIIKTLKHGNKIIYGQVLKRGFGTITLVVTDRAGSTSIKTFKESDCTIHIS